MNENEEKKNPPNDFLSSDFFLIDFWEEGILGSAQSKIDRLLNEFMQQIL